MKKAGSVRPTFMGAKASMDFFIKESWLESSLSIMAMAWTAAGEGSAENLDFNKSLRTLFCISGCLLVGVSGEYTMLLRTIFISGPDRFSCCAAERGTPRLINTAVSCSPEVFFDWRVAIMFSRDGPEDGED